MNGLHQSIRSAILNGLFGIAALSLAGCDDSPEGKGPISRLVVTGSSTVAPLLAEVAKRFEDMNPGARIDVQTGGSARGITDVRNGLADIGMVSRALGSKEADLQGFLVAWDELAMIVHSTNSIAEIPPDKIVAIYTGATENWRDLGGPDAPISVVHKAEGRSTLEVFLKQFKIENTAVMPDVVIGENEQGIKTVEANPTAIGYVSIGAAKVAMAEGARIKLLSVTGLSADNGILPENGASMSRELNLVTAKAPEGLVKSFIDYATSPAVDDLIASHSFVPPHR